MVNTQLDLLARHSPSAGVWRQFKPLLDLPFNDLIHRAQSVHRQHHDANAVQLSTLISVKTGGCPEDCGYCPQAARYHTNVENQDMLPLDEVVESAAAAKAQGATRFCMGAAWRGTQTARHRKNGGNGRRRQSAGA